MFNPFEPFLVEYIEVLAKQGNIYLVSQTFTRNPQAKEESKEQIILTDYNDPGLAKIHYKAVREDKYAAILYLNKKEHAHKLLSMLQPDGKYKIWWLVVRKREDAEKRLNLKYKQNVRRWITKNTQWHIPVTHEPIPSMQFIFGEIYLTLKYGSQTIQVKFDEIENS